MKEAISDWFITYRLPGGILILGVLLIYFSWHYDCWVEMSRISLKEYLSGLGIVCAALFAATKWNKERASEKAQNLYELIKKFETKELNAVFDIVENGRPEHVAAMCRRLSGRKLLFEVLTICDYMCYLLHQRLIQQSEFGFFAYKIKHIVSHPEVTKFLMSYAANSDGAHCKDGTFASLYGYAQKRHWFDFVDDIEVDGIHAPFDKNPINVKEFAVPTIVIRINRLYREGMSDDEVYEVARGNWRVNARKIGQYTRALAVANGIVKGVYAIDYWEYPDGVRVDYAHAGASERMRFVRKKLANNEVLRFKDRSVRGLFSQGDAYPIRYFG